MSDRAPRAFTYGWSLQSPCQSPPRRSWLSLTSTCSSVAATSNVDNLLIHATDAPLTLPPAPRLQPLRAIKRDLGRPTLTCFAYCLEWVH
jgi:hypothetical protein